MGIKRSAFLVVAATASVVGACAGDTNPMRDLAVAAGVTGGEPKPPPDFISRTRPTSAEYMPVGVSAPKRAYRAKTPTEISDAQKELDQVRARNEARGAAARRPDPQ